MAAAIVGDTAGYLLGRAAGPKIFDRPDSRFFKREHLARTHAFYEKHGGKTIIYARFLPIIRTFTPFVAGMAQMPYPRFLSFSVFGGSEGLMTSTLACSCNAHSIAMPSVVRLAKLRVSHCQMPQMPRHQKSCSSCPK